MPKKTLSQILIVVLIGIGLLFSALPKTQADELDDLNKQISDLTSALNKSIAATKPLESQLQGLVTQIAGIKNRVAGIERDVAIKKAAIDEGYKNLAEKEELLNKTIRNYYVKSYYNNPLLIFFSGTNAAKITQALAYQRAKTNQDKSLITNIALSITDLETKKATLQSEQERLIVAKATLDTQSQKLDEVVKGAKAYQSEVSNKLATLTAKQNEILTARSGGFTANVGDSDLADDVNASIKGFRDSAPGGYFAVFSFGGHSHRKGMSQYGARGRAQSGQNYKQILSKYYGKEPVSKDTGGTIKVSGHGELDFEGRYLLGIAEMPSSWHPEALKAQAIAARTYAYRYKQEGKEICTTEACQVYSSSKADNVPDSWKQAVEATKGEVLEDVVTYYSSTSGGWSTTSGWDTTDGNGGSNFMDRAYEKLGGSPWLYKAWYTKAYSINSDKCGRANPWLSPQEMADIVNAVIAFKTGGIDTGRITPVTTSCWGGNPYSMDELKNLVSGHGGISAATSVSVSQGNGITNTITINGISISASEFKRAFNVRAPGYLSIPQSDSNFGPPFFNIEKK